MRVRIYTLPARIPVFFVHYVQPRFSLSRVSSELNFQDCRVSIGGIISRNVSSHVLYSPLIPPPPSLSLILSFRLEREIGLSVRVRGQKRWFVHGRSPVFRRKSVGKRSATPPATAIAAVDERLNNK